MSKRSGRRAPATGSKGGSHGGPELTEPRADPGPAPPSTARGGRGLQGRAGLRSAAPLARPPDHTWRGPHANAAEPELLNTRAPSPSSVPAGSLGGRVRIAEAGRMWTLELDPESPASAEPQPPVCAATRQDQALKHSRRGLSTCPVRAAGGSAPLTHCPSAQRAVNPGPSPALTAGRRQTRRWRGRVRGCLSLQGVSGEPLLLLL